MWRRQAEAATPTSSRSSRAPGLSAGQVVGLGQPSRGRHDAGLGGDGLDAEVDPGALVVPRAQPSEQPAEIGIEARAAVG
jgi:hypothetical protein